MNFRIPIFWLKKSLRPAKQFSKRNQPLKKNDIGGSAL